MPTETIADKVHVKLFLKMVSLYLHAFIGKKMPDADNFIQSNFNGSNTFGTMKISLRQG